MESPDQGALSWHTDILPRATRHALGFMSGQYWLGRSRWYLAGGTALALQAGHRQSVDLDFFTPSSTFSMKALTERFPKEHWVTDIARENTVYGRLFGAKVSFIAYPFFRAHEPPLRYGAIRVLTMRDVAVMKIVAISQRGRKRDFIDLYWCVRHIEPLRNVLHRLPVQYPTVAHDFHHIMKSLVYFTDADSDPTPRLYAYASWRTVKTYFKREVAKNTKEFLSLRQ